MVAERPSSLAVGPLVGTALLRDSKKLVEQTGQMRAVYWVEATKAADRRDARRVAQAGEEEIPKMTSPDTKPRINAGKRRQPRMTFGVGRSQTTLCLI